MIRPLGFNRVVSKNLAEKVTSRSCGTLILPDEVAKKNCLGTSRSHFLLLLMKVVEHLAKNGIEISPSLVVDKRPPEVENTVMNELESSTQWVQSTSKSPKC
jgi:hypothetical protein